MAEEAAPLRPRAAPAAEEKRRPPGSSCYKDSFGLGRSRRTLPKKRERRHCQPAPFTPGVCRPGGARLRCFASGLRPVSHSPGLAPTLVASVVIKITEANREKKLSSPPCSPTDSAVLGLSNAEKLDPMCFLLGITNRAA